MRIALSVLNIVCVCLGTLLFAIGLTCLLGFPHFYEWFIGKALELSPGSQAYVPWQKSQTPISMSIYFFNWTNPEDFEKPDVKPRFKELGPYSFHQIKEKMDLQWNTHNDTVTFKYRKTFFFDAANSVGSLDDNVTTINMVALTAAHYARDWSFFFQQGVALSMINSDYFVTKTMRELLFDGYEDPILKSKKSLDFFGDEDQDTKFGWFYGRNNTIGSDGVFNLGTSLDEHFGTLRRWNYEPRTDFYDPQCASIHGSGGELYARHQTPDKIFVFSPEMCRTAQFNFEANITIKGVNCYKYSPGDEVFDNGTKIPGNECYCNGQCLPYGIMNTSACRENAPLFMSLPHFYLADHTYLDAIEGLTPNKSKHELYVALEPNIGVIGDIAARVQLNLLIQPISAFALFEKAPNVMFPIFWFEQKMLMTDELASGLSLLLSLPKIAMYVCIFLMVAGALAVVVTILYARFYKNPAPNIHHKHQYTIAATKEEIPLKTKA